jgi:peptidoglycan/xylan/chitin deacetylase (PgdA/CDA1 family)
LSAHSGKQSAAAGARRSVKWAAGAADAVLPTTGMVVLAYHRVGGGGTTQMDLPLERFRDQMAQLADTERVISLDDAIAEYSAGRSASPQPCVVLTFDDGTADFAEHVVTVLDEFELPATVYVATEPVLTGERWPDGAAPISPTALTDVAAHPLVTVGCHTHSHLLLDREPPAVVASDLDRSIEVLAELTGERPNHFAYPKALAPSVANDELIRERFVSAAVAGTRPNRAGRTDPYRLARSPIQRSDTPRDVAHKFAGGMRLEDDVRRLVQRVTYRGVRT